MPGVGGAAQRQIGGEPAAYALDSSWMRALPAEPHGPCKAGESGRFAGCDLAESAEEIQELVVCDVHQVVSRAGHRDVSWRRLPSGGSLMRRQMVHSQ